MKKAAIRLAALVFAIPSYGQTNQEYQHPLPLTVYVSSESDDSWEIKHAVDGRIAATTRYVVASNTQDVDLWVDIICYRLDKIVKTFDVQNRDAYVCRYDLAYWMKGAPIKHTLGSLESGNTSSLADHIFQWFVENSQADTLAKVETDFSGKCAQFTRAK